MYQDTEPSFKKEYHLSKADVSTLTIFSLALGSVLQINKYDLAGKASPVVLYAVDRLPELWKSFPQESGNRDKNTLKIRAHTLALSEGIACELKEFSAIYLALMSQSLLLELYDLVKYQPKFKIISEFLEIITGIVDILDPEQKNSAAIAEAERLCLVVKERLEL